MSESFPSFGGADRHQFEVPMEDRQENIENIEQLSVAPVQELGQRALESVNSMENLEENKADTLAEHIPVIDTAESLAERQEKLKRGIKSLLVAHRTLESQYLLKP